MFGNNRVERILKDPNIFEVNEIFYSIQGEGPDAGRPAIFVRFAGCVLQCIFCDTNFTSPMVLWGRKELLKKVRYLSKQYHCKFVVLTGGEPFRQNIGMFVSQLLFSGFHVQIETSGAIGPKWLVKATHPCFRTRRDRLTIICSPKTPKISKAIRKFINAYKYIVSFDDSFENGIPQGCTQPSGQDGIAKPPKKFSKNKIFLQPCDCKDEQMKRYNIEITKKLCLEHGYRLCLQLHKLVGLR